MKHVLTSLITLALVLPQAAAADFPEEPTLVQGSLGIMRLNDQDARWTEISDSDLANLFVVGAEWEFPLYTGFVHWGLNPGGSIGWQGDDTTFSGSINGDTGATVNFELDNSLFIAELHVGGYVRGRLTARITTYAAAGPALFYAEHKTRSERVDQPAALDGGDILEGDENASALDFGFYARAGIDFEVSRGAHMGFSVRYSGSELDFSDTIGNVDKHGNTISPGAMSSTSPVASLKTTPIFASAALRAGPTAKNEVRGRCLPLRRSRESRVRVRRLSTWSEIIRRVRIPARRSGPGICWPIFRRKHRLRAWPSCSSPSGDQ